MTKYVILSGVLGVFTSLFLWVIRHMIQEKNREGENAVFLQVISGAVIMIAVFLELTFFTNCASWIKFKEINSLYTEQQKLLEGYEQTQKELLEKLNEARALIDYYFEDGGEEDLTK